MNEKRKIERLLWSIALPGFGQFLNGKFLKGLLFIVLEILVNVQANLNAVIILSFHGDIETAINHTDYRWLLFYPCIYVFAIWDAYRDAGGGETPFSYLPFVMSAYIGTIGVIYSSSLKIGGVLLGPIFLSILFLIAGAGLGALFKNLLTNRMKKSPGNSRS